MKWQRASTQSYYRIEDGSCNVKDDSSPLLVNCSGVSVMNAPFRTYSPTGRHDYYLMYLVRGQLSAVASDTQHLLSPGDAIIYTPGRPYGYSRAGDQPMIYLWVHFTGSDAAALLKKRGLTTAAVYHLNRGEEIESDFEAIQHLFITRPLYYLEEASARLDLLITHISRTALQPEGAQPRDRLKASLNYLNRHYAEPIRLEALSGMEFLSVSRYSALFRQVMGVSPQQYLIDLRLRNAHDLIMNTDMSVSEVARSVGYDDPLYFSRLFRKHLGLSPREVRKSAP